MISYLHLTFFLFNKMRSNTIKLISYGSFFGYKLFCKWSPKVLVILEVISVGAIWTSKNLPIRVIKCFQVLISSSISVGESNFNVSTWIISCSNNEVRFIFLFALAPAYLNCNRFHGTTKAKVIMNNFC